MEKRIKGYIFRIYSNENQLLISILYEPSILKLK